MNREAGNHFQDRIRGKSELSWRSTHAPNPSPLGARTVWNLGEHGVRCRRTAATMFLVAACILAPQIFSQASSSYVPAPHLKQCGETISGIPLQTSASAVLRKAISVMDPSGIYRSTQHFSVSGSVSDSAGQENTQEQAGTFQVQEDHSVPGGNLAREFTINNVKSSVTRSNGVVSFGSSSTSSQDSSHAPLRKVFLFPLATLTDESENSSLSASFAANGGGASQTAFDTIPGFVHIQTVNHSSAQTSTYEVEDWYFDPKTSLPAIVGYEVPAINSPHMCVQLYFTFSDYQQGNGVLAPRQVSQRIQKKIRHYSVTTATVGGSN